MRSSTDDVGLDRLSDMPDQVIVHILSFMPTHDAVRTMLLRRFGNLWTFVSALMFDFKEYYVMSCLTDEDEDDSDDMYYKKQPIINEAISRFARFVQNVLMLHRRSTIESFHLDFEQYKGNYEDESINDDVQVWLRFAADRQVKHLYFMGDVLDDLAPPRCVFTSQNLVTLKLCGCMIEQYDHLPQLHMPSLRTLTFTGVRGSDEAFNQLISACPSLQEVDIYLAEGLINLNITAPSVRKLDLNILDRPDLPFTLNCPHLKILDIEVAGISPSFVLDVKDVSSLLLLNIGRLPEGSSGEIKAYLRQFRDADEVTLSHGGFQTLLIEKCTHDFLRSNNCVGKSTSIHTECLENLLGDCVLRSQQLCSLEQMDFSKNRWLGLGLLPEWDHERCLDVIVKLLKSSRELEELVLFEQESSGDCEVPSSELFTSCVIPLLKSVTIYVRGKCCQRQLQLVEFILRNAVVLEKLEIKSEEKQPTEVEEQVSRFKRASVNAVVNFN